MQNRRAQQNHTVVSSAQCEKDTELIYFFLISRAFLRMTLDVSTASWFLLVAVSALMFLFLGLAWLNWCFLLTDSKPSVSGIEGYPEPVPWSWDTVFILSYVLPTPTRLNCSSEVWGFFPSWCSGENVCGVMIVPRKTKTIWRSLCRSREFWGHHTSD